MTSSRFNCILIRYEGGHVYVDRAGRGPRRETYLNVISIKDRGAAEKLGNEILELAARTFESVVEEGTVKTQTQIPYVGWSLMRRVGEPEDNRMVSGFTLTQKDDGFASLALELDDPLQVASARLVRKIERLSRGSQAEYGTPQIAEPAQGSGTDTTPPAFSVSGLVADSDQRQSPLWSAPRPFWCSWIQVQLQTAGSTPTRVSVAKRNDNSLWSTSIRSVVLPAGQHNAIEVVNHGWAAGESLFMVVAEAGEGAQDLSVGLRGNMV